MLRRVKGAQNAVEIEGGEHFADNLAAAITENGGNSRFEKITVKGDIPAKAQFEIKSGSIVIEGNVLSGAAVQTQNGSVTVVGSVGNGSKIEANNGSVKVRQAVGEKVTVKAVNSNITVEGKIGDRSKFKIANGSIIIAGKTEFKRVVKESTTFNVNKDGKLQEGVSEQSSTGSININPESLPPGTHLVVAGMNDVQIGTTYTFPSSKTQ